MMLRILNNHTLVHGINEPHFYETLWAPGDEGRALSRQQGLELMERLITRQREGFFADVVAGRHEHEAGTVCAGLPEGHTRVDVFKAFMANETVSHGKRIACEKTPQNVFYLTEILRHFPEARVIVMHRDPRAVMLSQKRKWMRKDLGNAAMPEREVRRLRMNYHPYTISRLWNASFQAARRYQDHPAVLSLRFEDLTTDPHGTLERLCAFIGIPFEPSMLDIPHAGSSNRRDDHSRRGIRGDRSDAWRTELENEEIAICQRTCGANMAVLGYELVRTAPSALRMGLMWVMFPLKLVGALFLNRDRMRNIGGTLRRRVNWI